LGSRGAAKSGMMRALPGKTAAGRTRQRSERILAATQKFNPLRSRASVLSRLIDLPVSHSMTIEKTYSGACFCGAVKLSVSGDPVAMGYCHCESCRHWSAGPVNAFTLWQPGAVKITQGAENIGSYNQTANSYRKWCKNCGGHIFTEHPTLGLTDVYAAIIPEFPFQPGLHVNYQEATLHIHDGLPKMKDLPSEMGGSGLALAE
jgi:hypothetical protein